MPKTERYVDYDNKPLNLLGYATVNVKVGKRTIRVVITRDGKRSLIGRDWLNQLIFTARKQTEMVSILTILTSFLNERT